MTARDLEATLLTRCTTVAKAATAMADNQLEANVFGLAASAVRSRHPHASTQLRQASERYFAVHPHERLPAGDVVRNGWVLSLPRLRDMLSRQMHGD